MTVKVDIELDRDFTVPADAATVFALLSDVQKSGSHFPKVDTLSDMGDNVFKWEMEKIGLGGNSIQTIYACEYISDEAAGTVTWEPVKEIGNSAVTGSWTISEADGGTLVEFTTAAKLTLPLPGLLKMAISPVVKHEFAAMVDEYMENLQGTLSA